jgi:hypothetical protein
VVLFDSGFIFAQHMDLFRADTLGFQFLLDGFKFVEIVTDVIVPIHDTPPASWAEIPLSQKIVAALASSYLFATAYTDYKYSSLRRVGGCSRNTHMLY